MLRSEPRLQYAAPATRHVSAHPEQGDPEHHRIGLDATPTFLPNRRAFSDETALTLAAFDCRNMLQHNVFRCIL